MMVNFQISSINPYRIISIPATIRLLIAQLLTMAMISLKLLVKYENIIIYRQLFFIAKLTMLAGKTKTAINQQTQMHSKIYYFQSQISDVTPHKESCRRASPSFSHTSKQNHNHNIKQKPKQQQLLAARHSRGKTLREQINAKLQQAKGKKHFGSIITSTDQPIEPLSSIRKMLTESPTHKQHPLPKQRVQDACKRERAQQQEQFELRQSQMIILKKKKQELAKAEQLKKQIKECTFRPKLTPYRRL